MKVISAVQQKGGVGKSNCIVHLAHDFKERDLRVCVLDFDTQGNATFSMQELLSNIGASSLFRKDFTLPVINPGITVIRGDEGLVNVENMSTAEAGENLKKNVALLAEHFDVCLIDTAPALGVRMAAALYVSQFVFSPIEVAVYSILGVNKMKKTISNIQKVNPTLEYLGLIPSRYNSRNPLQVENLIELRRTHSNLVAPVVIGQRTSFEEALHRQIPVWKVKKTAARKAASEIREFAEYVFQKVFSKMEVA